MQRKKNTNNQTSQKAILAYFEKKAMIGELGATNLLKKKSTPKIIKKSPILFLLMFKVLFVECLFLATFVNLWNKTSFLE